MAGISQKQETKITRDRFCNIEQLIFALLTVTMG
jgi:hypothetical protein